MFIDSKAMPELAEVETVKSYLEKHIIGTKIIRYVQNRNNLRFPIDVKIKEKIESAEIVSVVRRAKYLLINLDNHHVIIIHLGMSGRLVVQSHEYIVKKHDHLQLYLDNGKQLIFTDTRRFGMIYCYAMRDVQQQKFISILGPEPLELEFSGSYLYKKLLKKSAPIKNAIMDQSIVVGVGNIYAAESLFAAKINPLKPASSLTILECEELARSIKNILQRAIKAGGTTLRDFVSGDNKPGYFKQELQVYGRENLPCITCNLPIKKIKQAGRSTFFCHNCQNN